jgi:hypothetical protein
MVTNKNFFAHFLLLKSHVTILPNPKKKNPCGINMLLSLTCQVGPPLFGIHDTMQRLSYYHETQIRLCTTLFVPNLNTKIIHTWSHPCSKAPSWGHKGVCHIIALPFTLKKTLRQKKNYENSNISPGKKYNLKK